MSVLTEAPCCEPCEKPETPIVYAVASLEVAENRLDVLLSSLGERLQPVLGPGVPSMVPPEQDRLPMSDLAAVLSDRAVGLHGLADRLEQLLDRLEV